jgi:hypothetical protein
LVNDATCVNSRVIVVASFEAISKVRSLRRPNASPDSLLGKIVGGAGKTSIRACFGMFYSAIPAETLGLTSGPYLSNY